MLTCQLRSHFPGVLRRDCTCPSSSATSGNILSFAVYIAGSYLARLLCHYQTRAIIEALVQDADLISA